MGWHGPCEGGSYTTTNAELEEEGPGQSPEYIDLQGTLKEKSLWRNRRRWRNLRVREAESGSCLQIESSILWATPEGPKK